jgi:hypothetical protein
MRATRLAGPPSDNKRYIHKCPVTCVYDAGRWRTRKRRVGKVPLTTRVYDAGVLVRGAWENFLSRRACTMLSYS